MNARSLSIALALSLFPALTAGCARPVLESQSPALAPHSKRRAFATQTAPTDPNWLRTPPPSLPMTPATEHAVVERRLAN
ncbi:MAG TPA: hypothetical protein VM580_04260, partial [Labilithrix sp.]|nr:hypothetical protein [Labilithrix sp.]